MTFRYRIVVEGKYVDGSKSLDEAINIRDEYLKAEDKENFKFKKKSSLGKSQYIYLDKRDKRYIVKIKKVFLGRFESFAAAEKIRDNYLISIN